MQMNNYWKKEENDYIKANYLTLSDEEMSKKINRTTKAVKTQRQKLKCYRPRKVSKKHKSSEKPSFSEVKKQFEKRGYILLSDESEFTTQTVKLRYLCPKHLDKGEL